MKKIKIGIIGSMNDIALCPKAVQYARELGELIGQSRNILLFGFEGDFNSLSQIAAMESEKAGGKTVAFIRGDTQIDVSPLSSTQIVTRQERGGGREFVFILSCDIVVSIGGGSGTLMEMAMAYQAGIPVIALKNTGGWSEKLAGTFLDERKRLRIVGAKTPIEVMKIITTYSKF